MSGERAWKAIDRLKNGEKWTQGTLYYAGSRCLLGALGNCRDSEDMGITEDRVARRLPLEVKAASMIIDEQFPDRVHNRVSGVIKITSFNDHTETTYDDVRLVLEKTAVRLDELV